MFLRLRSATQAGQQQTHKGMQAQPSRVRSLREVELCAGAGVAGAAVAPPKYAVCAYDEVAPSALDQLLPHNVRQRASASAL